MIEVRQTDTFKIWLAGLSDQRARNKVTVRIARVAAGLLGDAKSVGDGVSELRIDYGPGYRLYFSRRDQTVIILLCGGEKSNQSRDIKLAKLLVLKV